MPDVDDRVLGSPQPPSPPEKRRGRHLLLHKIPPVAVGQEGRACHRRSPRGRPPRNPTEASRADIEKDVTSWYFGFASGIKLLDQNAMLPRLETVLVAALEKFEEGDCCLTIDRLPMSTGAGLAEVLDSAPPPADQN